jgi:hypothetical protein
MAVVCPPNPTAAELDAPNSRYVRIPLIPGQFTLIVGETVVVRSPVHIGCSTILGETANDFRHGVNAHNNGTVNKAYFNMYSFLYRLSEKPKFHDFTVDVGIREATNGSSRSRVLQGDTKRYISSFIAGKKRKSRKSKGKKSKGKSRRRYR